MMKLTAFIAGLFAMSWATGLGCSPAVVQNAENAAAVAQYTALLEHCRARGKVAGSYAVYAACADAVDRDLCVTYRLRCSDGGP